MKFPKLKHTVLCQVLLYLPAFSIFIWAVAAELFPGSWTENYLLGFVQLFLVAGISLGYLFYNFAFLMCSDIMFSEIRQWRKDREEYHTYRNGRSREEIQKTLLRRCARWGERFQPKKRRQRAFEVYYHHGYAWTRFRSAIEEQVVVYTTDSLSEEEYHQVGNQVRSVIHHVPKGKLWLKPKAERKGPRAEACVILFLADRVEDEVKKLARKPIMENDDFCILPCVVQCTDGCYYTKCTAEYFEPGLTIRPAVNYAVAMVRRLVFARRVPKENRATQPAWEWPFDIDTSLWEYIRTFRRKMHGVDDELARDRAKAYHHMRDGEVRIGDWVVWYKKENRLAEYSFMAAAEDERLVVVADDSMWYYKKDEDFVSRVLFKNDLDRKRMKKEEKMQIKPIIRAALIGEGYQIEQE